MSPDVRPDPTRASIVLAVLLVSALPAGLAVPQEAADADSVFVVFSDDFNDGTVDTDKWTVNLASEKDECGFQSSPFALTFDGSGGDRKAATTSLDVSGGGEVRFYLKYGKSDGCEHLDSTDEVSLEYSTDGGSSWTAIATYDSGGYGSFTEVVEAIPSAAATSSTRFRWIQTNYCSSSCDEWAIDDVEIRSTLPVAEEPVSDEAFADDFNDRSIDETKWDTKDMFEVEDCGTAEGAGALVAGDDPTRHATTRPIDTQAGAEVRFALTLTGHPCDDPEAGEGVELQHRTPDAGSWTTIDRYEVGDDRFDGWSYVNVSIPVDAWSEATRFRWIQTGAEDWDDHWAIDDVEIDTPSVPDPGGPDPDVPVTLFHDSFSDGEVGEEWTTAGAHENLDCTAVSPPSALMFNSAHHWNPRYAATPELDVQVGGAVRFELKIGQGSNPPCENPEPGEGPSLEYTTPDMLGWRTIAYYAPEDHPVFTPVREAIPEDALSERTRFRWVQHDHHRYDHWAIDDVAIVAV